MGQSTRAILPWGALVTGFTFFLAAIWSTMSLKTESAVAQHETSGAAHGKVEEHVESIEHELTGIMGQLAVQGMVLEQISKDVKEIKIAGRIR